MVRLLRLIVVAALGWTLALAASAGAVAAVPEPPTGVVAVAGDGEATVSFVPPTNDGGSAITGYTVTSNPPGGVDTDAGSTATTHTITGLANEVAYTFTVIATSAEGPSAPSAPSNSVTPPGARTRLVVPGGAATTAKTVPGGSVSFDVRLDAWVPTVGVAFRLAQTSPAGSGYFSITARDFTGSIYDDAGSGTSDALVLAPASALLDPDNDENLGRHTVNLVGAATGTDLFIERLTLTASLATPVGTYVVGPLTPGASSTITDDLANDYPMGGSFTIVVGQSLTVVRDGSGTGTVTADTGAIDCGDTCSDIYAGTQVTLTAVAAADSFFGGWSGEGCAGTGPCVVTVDAARTVTATFTAKIVQTIGPITSVPPTLVYSNGGTFTVSASGGGSGNPVTFTSQTPLVCTTGGTFGATVTMLAVGTCTIAANQAGDATHAAAAQATQGFAIAPISQTIGPITSAPPTLVYSSGGTFTVSASGGGSGNPVTFTSQTPPVCTTGGTNGATVTMLAAGLCTVAANQAGDATHAPAPQATQGFTIAQASQAIGTITSVPPTLVYSNGGSFTVSASGGASGNPVTFTSQTPLVCATGGLNGATVSMLAAGDCTIAANQAGDANHAAAPERTQVFTVLPTPPQLTGAASRKLHGGAGAFDLALGLNPANPTTEPRSGGTTGSHTLVFTFDQPVLAADVAITEGTATLGTPTFGGNEISIPLSAVANEAYLTVTVSNVAAAGGTGGSGSARVGFLVADVNGSRNVTLSDLLGVNAVLAQIVTAANFLRDVNASGTLSVADILVVNANLTRVLPLP